jgi:outer membrane protein assembly factor BamB
MAENVGRGLALGRRSAILLPLTALGGCGFFDNLFFTPKDPLPGRRETVMAANGQLSVPPGPKVVVDLPVAVSNTGWPQPGGDPSHVMGHLAAGDRLNPAWRASIGDGGGFRQKITSQPLVTGGRVFAMDSNAAVSAFDAQSGQHIWSTQTRESDDRSTNVGGGITSADGMLYAATGRGNLVAIDAANGEIKWRQPLGSPARCAPTVVEGRIFVTTIEQELLALSNADGKRIWSFQATTATTAVLGQAAPAFAEGLVVVGFGSGELVAARAATGSVAWTDSIASASGRNSLADLSAITGMPVIEQERVYVIGLGGLLVSIDLRAGRRLWSRDVAGSQTPWLAGHWLFIVTVDQQIAALDARDGRVAWLSDLPQFKDMEKQKDRIEWLGPVLVGDRLVVAGTGGVALAISPYTGETLGSQKLADAASVAPVVAAGTMYVITDDGSLQAFR